MKQIGATFVIGAGDRVRYEHMDADSTDHAPIDEVVAVLREHLSGGQGRHLRLLQHARGDHELRSVVGGARRRARLRPPAPTCASAGGTTASTAPSTTSTRLRVITTSPGSSRGCGRCSPIAECRATVQDVFIERVREIGAPQPHRRLRRGRRRAARAPARGVALAICSNWDWDLHEAVESAGLTGSFDVVVSSAWVGARKPHPRIYAHTLEQLGIAPEDALVRRRHVDVRRRRSARRRDARGVPPPRRISASTTPRPDARALPADVHHARDLRAARRVDALLGLSRRDGRPRRRCRRASRGTAAAARRAGSSARRPCRRRSDRRSRRRSDRRPGAAAARRGAGRRPS